MERKKQRGLSDLNEILFDELDRLVGCSDTELDAEIKRARMVSDTAKRIISASNMQIQAIRLREYSTMTVGMTIGNAAESKGLDPGAARGLPDAED